jgi:hypothetical protein
MDFGNMKNPGGCCNACFAGEKPYIPVDVSGESGFGRTVETLDIVDYGAAPDDAATVRRKMDASLAAAKSYADGCPPELMKDKFIPFAKQGKVQPDQQLFLVVEGIYVGSEYAASDIGLLRGAGISRIINISSGARTVPNHGENVAGWDVVYKHFPLEDRIGFDVASAEAAFDEGLELMSTWLAQDHRVLVHCSAGLSRSASMVMAFLMSARGATLSEAVGTFAHSPWLEDDSLRARRLTGAP